MTETDKDGFEILEPRNLIVLGDAKGQVKACGGLLIDITRDPKYSDKVRYLLVFKDGDEYELAGNAALSQRISAAHIGCIVKFRFGGWSTGGGNKAKLIEVRSLPRDKTSDELKAMFPRWNDFADGATPPAGGEPPAAEKEEEEDIGF